MKNWIISVFIIVTLSNLIILISPNNKLFGLVKCVIGFIVICFVLNPLLNIKEITFSDSEIVSPTSTVQYDFLIYIFDKRIEKYKENILSIYKNNGFSDLTVNEIEINYQIKDENLIIDKILVNLSKIGIKNKNEHINILNQIEGQIHYIINNNLVEVEYE